MVRHTLKTLQYLLQGFLSVCDHFSTLYTKGLTEFELTYHQMLKVILSIREVHIE